jgi:uncharacterized protein (TIGR02996 family)
VHDAFLRTIIANPEDDAPRLVYADWLDETEERANIDRAEFIRLQCHLEALPADAPERPRLLERERALLNTYAKEWAELFRGIIVMWSFRRGFIESASVDLGKVGARFSALFGKLVKGTPLREVLFYQPGGEFDCLLPATNLLTRIRSVLLRGRFPATAGPTLRTLFESEHLSGLTRLELESTQRRSWFRPRVLCAILQSPGLKNLTDLTLVDYTEALQSTVVRTLARSTSLANLKRLCIENTPFDRAGLGCLVHAHYGPNLEALELCGCHLEGGAWNELLAPDVLPNLKRLVLLGTRVNRTILRAGDPPTERLLAQLRARFGPSAVDIEEADHDRPRYNSWEQM